MGIINKIYDAIYYGTDLEFFYNGYYYFINSGKIKNKQDNDIHSIKVLKSLGSFYETNSNNDVDEIYTSENSDSSINTDKLCNEKIFDSESLYEIVDKITKINY